MPPPSPATNTPRTEYPCEIVAPIRCVVAILASREAFATTSLPPHAHRQDGKPLWPALGMVTPRSRCPRCNRRRRASVFRMRGRHVVGDALRPAPLLIRHGAQLRSSARHCPRSDRGQHPGNVVVWHVPPCRPFETFDSAPPENPQKTEVRATGQARLSPAGQTGLSAESSPCIPTSVAYRRPSATPAWQGNARLPAKPELARKHDRSILN